MRFTAILSLCWFFCFGAPLATEAHTYTPSVIAAAMAASEAQVSSIRYHFNVDGNSSTTDNLHSRVYVDAQFAMKQPEGDLFYHIKSTNSNTGVVPTHAEVDLTIAFDGAATMYIYNTRDEWGRLSGVVLPGFAEQQFSGLENPHLLTWGMGGTNAQWSQMLADNPAGFTVSPDLVRIDNIDTVRLVGPRAKDSQTLITLWIAPSRGFLPIQMQTDYPDGPTCWRNLQELLEIMPHVWYPQRIVEHAKLPDGQDQPTNLRTIDHIDCTALDHSFFRPTFPPGTRITDHVSKMVIDIPASTTQPLDRERTERELRIYLDKANAATLPTPAMLPTPATLPSSQKH